MTHFDGVSDIRFYLVLFEKQIAKTNIVKEDWVTYLLSLFPLEIVNIIARKPNSEVNDYEYVKNLIHNPFKMTPKEFREKFILYEKELSAIWSVFAFE